MVSTDYISNFGAQAVHLIYIFPFFFSNTANQLRIHACNKPSYQYLHPKLFHCYIVSAFPLFKVMQHHAWALKAELRPAYR